MNILEKYPLPWAIDESEQFLTDRDGRPFRLNGSELSEAFKLILPYANALAGVENPVEWLAEENRKYLSANMAALKALNELEFAKQRIEHLEANALESTEEYKLAVQWITELKAARLRIAELEAQVAALQKPLPCSTLENMPPEELNLSECIGMIAELWDETQDVIKESCYEKHPYEISDRPYTEKGFAWGRTLEDGLNVKEILYKRQ